MHSSAVFRSCACVDPPLPTFFFLQAAFSEADVGKPIVIKSGKVTVDGASRAVRWREAVPKDCSAKVYHVDPRPKGNVAFTTGTCSDIENPALTF